MIREKMRWNKNNHECDICGGEGKLIHCGVRDRGDVDVYMCQKCDTKFLVSNKFLENDYENGFMNTEKNPNPLISIEERLKECVIAEKR